MGASSIAHLRSHVRSPTKGTYSKLRTRIQARNRHNVAGTYSWTHLLKKQHHRRYHTRNRIPHMHSCQHDNANCRPSEFWLCGNCLHRSRSCYAHCSCFDRIAMFRAHNGCHSQCMYGRNTNGMAGPHIWRHSVHLLRQHMQLH